MKNFLQKFRKAMGFPFLLLIIMVLFLGAVLGTSGSTISTGESFELQYNNTSGDSTNWSWVTFKVSAPKTKDENGKETNMSVRLHDAYINIGTIYSGAETVTLELKRTSSAPSSSSSAPNLSEFVMSSGLRRAVFYNSAYVPKEGDKPTEETDSLANYVRGAEYSWVAPFGVNNLSTSYKNLSSPVYFLLRHYDLGSKSNILINEIVFVGEVLEDGEGTGKYVVLPVEIDSRTYLPYDAETEGKEDAIARAGALIDKQRMPVMSSSSFYEYGAEEKDMLRTLSEIRMGNQYIPYDWYSGDTTYNSLGLNLTYLGTLIFGTSPFGVRFFSSLASFGILVVGFFFVRRLFHGSDKAGISFAIIYAFAGATISLAHLASPVMLGVFFLISSLAACYRYYAVGMKKASPMSTMPLLLSGLAGACAVLVNGAFVIPVAGVVALFIAGLLKQRKKDRAALEEAIAFAEDEKKNGVVPAKSEGGEEETQSEGQAQLQKAYNAYRYDLASCCSVFLFSLIFGIFVLSVLLVLPVSYAANKIYNGIASASPNLFQVAFRLFAAGFSGDKSGWNYLYPVFTGAGESYAVTLGIMNFTASLLGLVGIALAIYRIVLLAQNKAPFKSYLSVLIPCAGLVLSLVTAAFAGGSVAFVLLANLFAFMLVSGGGEQLAQQGEKQAKAVFIVKIISLVLLALCFGLLAVFTFSVPLPAAFMANFF